MYEGCSGLLFLMEGKVYTSRAEREHEPSFLFIYESIDPERSVLSCLVRFSEKGRKERRESSRAGWWNCRS